MFSLNLNNYLDTDEKIALFFRPSRKAYILHYRLCVLMLIGTLILLSYSAIHEKTSILFKILFYFSLIFLSFVIILIIRVEYRIWSRKYALTNERILYSRGIFSEKFKSATYGFITDVAMNQTLWDKIMNTGTIKINTAGTDRYEIKYREVSDPFKTEKLINEQIAVNSKAKVNRADVL
jgi:uncharacterized membrane protein YdbT with pleckstrin-like domain